MLRRTHVAPFTQVADGELTIDFMRDTDGRVVAFLERLLRLVRRLARRPRTTVVEALRRQERRVRDARRLSGIAKTLLDRCTFRPAPDADRAAAVRTAVFAARARYWPPVPGDEDVPYAEAAAALGMTAAAARAALYADAPGAAVLARPPRLDGHGLLARYNLELARAVLLDAERLVLTARGNWKETFRAIKLARLMYRIERAGGTRRTYRVELTGPAAPYLVRPQRYGVRMARALPAFVRGTGWRIEADIVRDGRRLHFRLDPSSPVALPRRRVRYDSAWERSLAEDFARVMGTGRRDWTLAREAEPVAAAGELFLPDFTLRHRDGREALVEIVGFWTPDYLARKQARVEAAGLGHLVLVVFRGLSVGATAAAAERLAATTPVVWFAQRPRAAPVLAAAEAVARRPA